MYKQKAEPKNAQEELCCQFHLQKTDGGHKIIATPAINKAGRLRGVNRPAGLRKWRQSKRNKASPPESMGQACNCLNAAALTAGTAGPACDIASIFLLALCRPGGPCAWAVRRASYSPQIKNATQNPRPILVGVGIRPPLRGSSGCRYYRPWQRWMSALPTAEYGATLLACGKGASRARA